MHHKNGRGPSVLAAIMMLWIAAGCGTVHHSLELNDGYVPKAGATVKVGPVSNQTGKIYDMDVETMLRDALTNAFTIEGLAVSGATAGLMTNCRILTFDAGNAFKRWLMPGWGATELSIQCDLQDKAGTIGNINAKRTVDGGGAYTIGAWKNVFIRVASDVAQDIRERFNGTGNAAGETGSATNN